MKKILLLFVGISFLLGSCQKEVHHESRSQDHLIMSVLWYQKSAEMQAMYYQCFNWAKIRVDMKTNDSSGSKKAVIVDIDETMLDNSPFETHCINTGKSYTKETWSEWTSKISATALPGALDFTKYAQSKNVEVFYISNRSIDDFDVTLKNLQKEGFAFADSAHLLLKTNTSSKTIRRNKVKQNFDIILLIGDNLDDFSEIFEDRSTDLGFGAVEKNKTKFGDLFIMLPNPMYGSWENAIFNNRRDLSSQEKYTLRKENLVGY